MNYDPDSSADINRYFLAGALAFGALGALLFGVITAELRRPGISIFSDGIIFSYILVLKTIFFSLATASVVGIGFHALIVRSNPVTVFLSLFLPFVTFFISMEAIHGTVSSWMAGTSALNQNPGSLRQSWHQASLFRFEILLGGSLVFSAMTLALLILKKGSRAARPYLFCALTGLFLLLLFQSIYFTSGSSGLRRAFTDTYIDVALEVSITAQILLSLILWASISVSNPKGYLNWFGAFLLQLPIFFLVSTLVKLGRQGAPKNYPDYPDAFAENMFIMSSAYFVLIAVALAILLLNLRKETKFETVFD